MEWEWEARNLNYVHRWLVKNMDLPSPVRLRVINWAKEISDPIERKFYAPIIDAFNKNDRKVLTNET